jgi:hypothetical protein
MADQQIAGIAQQAAHLAGQVIVIHMKDTSSSGPLDAAITRERNWLDPASTGSSYARPFARTFQSTFCAGAT